MSYVSWENPWNCSLLREHEHFESQQQSYRDINITVVVKRGNGKSPIHGGFHGKSSFLNGGWRVLIPRGPDILDLENLLKSLQSDQSRDGIVDRNHK